MPESLSLQPAPRRSNSAAGRPASRLATSGRRIAALAGLSTLLALPGCSNISGTPTTTQIRVVDASPDAPGLDVYEAGSVLAYNLGLGTITSYVPLSPGTYGIQVDQAGTHTQFASASGTFGNNAQYTVLIGNYAATLQELILKDQNTPAPSGQIAVRFIDESTRAGAVDVYLVPSGSTLAQVRPILTNVAFSMNTGYFNVPSATYTLVALPTGTVPTATTTTDYTGAAVGYASGAARTFILLDQQLITTPGIQVITADDFDAPGTV